MIDAWRASVGRSNGSNSIDVAAVCWFRRMFYGILRQARYTMMLHRADAACNSNQLREETILLAAAFLRWCARAPAYVRLILMEIDINLLVY